MPDSTNDELRDFLRKRIANISTAAEDDILAFVHQHAEQAIREAKLEQLRHFVIKEYLPHSVAAALAIQLTTNLKGEQS